MHMSDMSERGGRASPKDYLCAPANGGVSNIPACPKNSLRRERTPPSPSASPGLFSVPPDQLKPPFPQLPFPSARKRTHAMGTGGGRRKSRFLSSSFPQCFRFYTPSKLK